MNIIMMLILAKMACIATSSEQKLCKDCKHVNGEEIKFDNGIIKNRYFSMARKIESVSGESTKHHETNIGLFPANSTSSSSFRMWLHQISSLF